MNCLVLMIYPVLRNDLRLGKKYEMPITFLMTALVNFFTNTGLKVSYNYLFSTILNQFILLTNYIGGYNINC